MKFSRCAVMPLLTLAMLPVQKGLAVPHATEFANARMAFEPNRGQADRSVRYLSRGPGYTLFLRDQDAILALSTGKRSFQSLGIQWLNAGEPSIRPEEPGRSVTNYLTSTVRQTGISNFGKVRYSGLYDGIDVVYYGTGKQLEYDLIVRPGANPSEPRFRIEGANSVALHDGELQISLPDREVTHRKPVVYQTIDGVRREVAGEYVLLASNEVGFKVGKYDRAHDLVIDPVVSYTRVYGGNALDQSNAIAIDAGGNAYVTGFTTSSNLPLINPYRSTFQGVTEAFVMKLNAAGQPVYVTFLGGTGDDSGNAIAVDSTGAAYIAGQTSSVDMFPSPLRAPSGGTDAYVAKLSAAGNQLVYGTYLGGTGEDFGQGIVVNTANDAFITGWTTSTNLNGATRVGSSAEAFLARVNAAGSAIVFTGYSGGSGDDRAYAIAIDPAGNIYIGGETGSSNIPGTPFQPAFGGGLNDGFVAKWQSNGTPVYWAYLGGNNSDIVRGLAVDSAGSVYAAGVTLSPNFPVVSAFQSVLGGGSDAFVTKINNLGTAITWSTLLGGNFEDAASSIAVSSTNSVYVGGYTRSTQGFPLVSSIKTTSPGITFDGFVTHISSTGTSLFYSSTLGGSLTDVVSGIAVDAAGAAYVSGYTFSTELIGSATAPENLVMKIDNTCSYNLSPSAISVSAGPQSRTVTIDTSAGCAWTAGTTGGFASISGTASGTGPGSVRVSFSGNPGLARTGSVAVGGQSVALSQSGSIMQGCTYALSSSSASVPASGTNSTFTVTTTGSCTWEAYSNASWLQVFPLSGTGNSTVFYSVYPNFTTAQRSATITVGGRPFTVTQAPNTLNADQRFVQLIYFSFFGRLPSASEMEFQISNGLSGNPKDYAGLTMNFLNSQEFNLGGRFVAGIYVGLLDRDPEFGGYQFQRNAYTSGQISPEALVNNFLTSSEYSLRFGSPTPQQFVQYLYQYVLLRTGSAAEINGQVNQLQPNGPLTRAGLAINFLNSTEFRQGTGPRLTAFLLYATLLLREPSAAEKAVRIPELTGASQAKIKQIAAGIIQSGEFKAVVGWP